MSMKTYDHLFSKNLDKYVKFDDKLKVNGIHHLCVNCCRLLLLSEMPAISHYNGLGFTNPPEKLTMLENQLIVLMEHLEVSEFAGQITLTRFL